MLYRVWFVDACPYDQNGDGVLNSDDFFAFVIDYFLNDADFDGNGRTDSDDFFGFLEVFLAGC